MWSKVANAFRRNDVDASAVSLPQDESRHPSQDESASDSVAEPGSHFSPPGSPSRNTKRGLLRRGSRLLDKENGVPLSLAKRVKSSFHLNNNMNESNMSLAINTKADAGAQPTFGSVRSIFSKDRRPSAMQMQAAMNKSDDTLNRQSEEMYRPASPSPASPIQGPLTPLDARQFGSVRSILRDKNTPGSGQNVRFFSRDAYHVISPNTSTSASADHTGSSADPEPPFMQRIQEMSPDRDGASQDTTRYLSANSSPNMFSPASTYASANSAGFNGYPTATSTPYVTPNATQGQQTMGSVVMPVPPQISGIFDFSAAQEHSVHSIHGSGESALRDNAVEVDESGRPTRSSTPVSLGPRPPVNIQTENRVSSHSTASSMSIETPNSVINNSEHSLQRLSDSQQTHFHSLPEDGGDRHDLPPRSGSSLGFHKVFKRDSTPKLEFPGSTNASSRVRALSDRVFSRPSVGEPKDKGENDNLSPHSTESPDPFSADASNYYNPAAGFPKTPPRIGHVRSDSVVSGVSMNSGMSVSTTSHRSATSRSSRASATQTREFHAEDDIIASLRTQLAFHQELATQYELDINARVTHAALMNQKLQAHEAEAERRARAMRGMRKRVSELERAAAALEEQAERSALENFERSVMDGASGDAVKILHQQMVDLEREKVELVKKEKEAKAESVKLIEELRLREEALQELKTRLENGHSDGQGVVNGLEDVQAMLDRTQEEARLATERHQEIALAWAGERARLVGDVEDLQKEIGARTNELNMVKSEVEAQWRNTENLNEKADKLQKERNDLDREREHLKNEIAVLERRIVDMEIDWTESENRKSQLEHELATVLAAKEEVEKERDQLHHELALVGLNGGNYGLALANMETQVKSLKDERQRALDGDENEVEQLRAELASMRREHARMQTENARALSDVHTVDLHNETAQRQVAAEAEAKELRDRVTRLQAETEKLKMNIRVLKQESADQDVKILQLEKQHDQDTDDKVGLNIALDSKQQELELIKRNMGVRGTAGATPAPPTRAGARRDSAAFKTPIPLRPSSSLSDGVRRLRTSLSDTERSGKMSGAVSTAGKATLAKSTRPNAASGPTPAAAVKKAPRLSDTSISAPPGRIRVSAAEKPAVPRAGAAVAKRVKSPDSTATNRRNSIAISGIGHMSDTSSALSDKENETPKARPLRTAERRMSMQPLVMPA